MELEQIIDLIEYPITSGEFKRAGREKLDRDGVLILPGFLNRTAIDAISREGIENEDKAYFCTKWHNAYLTPSDPDHPKDHPRNREVVSSKGCITDDQIPKESPLRTLYDSPDFKGFLAHVLTEEALYPYADSMSSINLHYARTGQELGWHFDESSFSITLMIQPASKGGTFEYVGRIRDADKGEMNVDGVDKVLNDAVTPEQLSMDAGALVMFRGRNSIHRVTPNEGDTTRMLVVLAYNSEPGIALSEPTQMTFYGRVA